MTNTDNKHNVNTRTLVLYSYFIMTVLYILGTSLQSFPAGITKISHRIRN